MLIKNDQEIFQECTFFIVIIATKIIASFKIENL